MIRRLVVILVLLLVLPVVFAQAGSQSTEFEVRNTLTQFIHAFDNLDWKVFRSTFDDKATVFYPRAFPERANGRAEFEKTFKIVFEQIRNGRTAGPSMDI